MIQAIEFQEQAANKIAAALSTCNAYMITDPPGFGKTYSICLAVQQLLPYITAQPRLWPVVWITKATAVTQTKRVIKEFKLDNVIKLVTNYDQFRSSFGENFIEGKWEILKGVETFVYHWSPIVIPRLIIVDECQALKGEASQQTRIFQCLIDYLHTQDAKQWGVECKWIFSSASSGTTIAEHKAFATATQVMIKFGWSEEPLTSRTWPSFAASCCAFNCAPHEHSAKSMANFREKMGKYIYRTRYQDVQKSFAKLGRKLYHPRNTTIKINFRTPEQKEFYEKAYERFLDDLAKIDREAPGGIAELWVAILKFRQAAELCRSEDLAEMMISSVAEGRSAACACNFKATIGKAIGYLINTKGISRSDISVIWGGMSDIPDEYDGLELGPQSQKQRQKEIDKFQRDESHYCFYTFKAGGVALSLHHAEPHMRQREGFFSPTYSAIETFQAAGRLPRITSWSDTPQTWVFYAGTIEEQVEAKVRIKLASLRELVSNPSENWSGDIVRANTKQLERVKEILSREVELKEGDDEGLYIDEDDSGNDGPTIDV
jgi:hypothetical protein